MSSVGSYLLQAIRYLLLKCSEMKKFRHRIIEYVLLKTGPCHELLEKSKELEIKCMWNYTKKKLISKNHLWQSKLTLNVFSVK